MRKLQFLLRFGLACTTLTVASASAAAQTQDQEAETLPPIVQAVDDPQQDDAAAPSAVDEATVEAASELAADVPPSVAPAPFRFNPVASPFRLQPLKPIFEAVPIVQSVPERSSQMGSRPALVVADEESLQPVFAGNQLPPIAQDLSDGGPQTDMPPATSFVDQEFLPPITTADQLPPIVQSAPEPLEAPAFDHTASYAIPEIPSFASDEVNDPSVPLVAPANLATEIGTAAQPANLSVAVADPFDPLAQEPAPEPIPQPANPTQPPTGELAAPTAPGLEPNEISSGYDRYGRCAFCGGKGCEHCTGGTPLIDHAPGASPVMEVSSEVVDDLEVQTIGGGYDCCGFMTYSSSGYAAVDFLYWERAGGTVFGGNFNGFDDFDLTRGGRVTVGHRFDCATGCELSGFYLDPWRSITVQTDALGRLRGNLSAGTGFASSSLSAFRNATYLEQFQKSDLGSIEYNKTTWGWDVVKTYVGLRYIYFDDEFRLSSANLAGEQGWYFLDTTNQLLGPQIGWEFFYDIGYRLSFSFNTKVGAYLNWNRGRTAILNDSAVVLNNVDTDIDASASAEVGFHGHYQILPRVRARFGYDVLGLWGVATTQDNFTGVVTPATGLAYEDDDDTFFHGVFLGVEFYR
jgi:hypothetical protein